MQNTWRFFMSVTACLWAAVICLALSQTALAQRDKKEFYLRDGDKVLFYGDSITEQHLYTNYIETFCVSRFPEKKFSFVNSGWSGDRVGGGGGGSLVTRIKRDILPHKPTVITICLGMNDAGYRNFDKSLFDTYVNQYRFLLDNLRKELPQTRITLMAPPAFDDVTRTHTFTGGYNSILQTYGQAVEQLAKEYGHLFVDLNKPMVTTITKANEIDMELAKKFIPDRVHPGPAGQLIMAATVLKAWNAPSTAVEIEINVAKNRVEKRVNATVANLQATKDKVSYTQYDMSLPWPIDRDEERNKEVLFALELTDYEKTLNVYSLKVTGLASGKYRIIADGKEIVVVTKDDLQFGLNLATVPNFPNCVLAREALRLTNESNNIYFERWRKIQFPLSRAGEPITDADALKKLTELDTQREEVLKRQRGTVRPQPLKIEITKVE